MKTTLISTTAAAVLSVALLAGCSTTPTDETYLPPLIPTIEPTAPAVDDDIVDEDEEGEVVDEVVEVGGTVTAEQADALNRDFRSPESAYQLPDGTHIVISRDQPLPDVVKGAMNDSLNVTVENSHADFYESVNREIVVEQQATGRKIVKVAQVQMFCTAASESRQAAWTVLWEKGVTGGCQSTRDAAVSHAQQFISSQERPDNWDIIG